MTRPATLLRQLRHAGDRVVAELHHLTSGHSGQVAFAVAVIVLIFLALGYRTARS